jgi:hypothetical protein
MKPTRTPWRTSGAPAAAAPARRAFVTTALALAGAAALPVAAQTTTGGTLPATGPMLQMPVLGVFGLLGDTIQVTLADAPTDTRLDRNVRETLDLRDLGLDQVAMRAVRQAITQHTPKTRMHLFRATEPIALADQRLISDGAMRGELPAWVIQAIERNKLTHVMMFTRHRGPALLRQDDGNAIGRGNVEGIGFYIDPIYETQNRLTGIITQGALGAYVDMRLTLMEVSSGNVLVQHAIRDGRIYGARTDEQAQTPWNILEPREKVEILRRMVEENVGRVLPGVLRAAAS